MRIVGGIYRSRKLAEFKGMEIRPTADSVRESLFNILRGRVEDCDFLDLYSGTGAVGLEALSRGAGSVTFNDLSRDSIAVLKKNLDILKAEKGVVVSNAEASAFLAGRAASGVCYDIIYIDPPYELGADKAVPLVFAVLKGHGIAVYENEKPFVGEVPGLVKYDERKYGRAYLTFFKKDK